MEMPLCPPLPRPIMLSSDLKYMLSMSDKREWQRFITWIDAQV